MTADSTWLHKGGTPSPDLPTITDAYDEFLVTASGTELIDAISGSHAVNLGHSVPGMAEVVTEQLDQVSLIDTGGFTHTPGEQLADKLAEMTPGDLNTVFFANSGSEANEAAFKLARAAAAPPRKHLIVGRWQSYHGATLGALSASGRSMYRQRFRPLLKDWPHIEQAYPYRWRFSGSPEEQGIAAARELETTIRREGPENVAAFVAEPIGGSSLPAAHPHPAYYREIRRICTEHDVQFVADEILVGFGRTGTLFASEHFDVVPDMMTISKGLTNGYSPMSAVMIRDGIAAGFTDDVGKRFNHGHAFGGNPLSAAVASHVVDQYTDSLLRQCRKRGDKLAAALDPLRSHPNVGDIRYKGLLLGIELVADRSEKRPFAPDCNVAHLIAREALDRGVCIAPSTGTVDGIAGDQVMVSPPLIVSEDAISEIAAALVDSIETVTDGLSDERRNVFDGTL